MLAILQALELLNSFRPGSSEDYGDKIYPVEIVAPGIKFVTFVSCVQLKNLRIHQLIN